LVLRVKVRFRVVRASVRVRVTSSGLAPPLSLCALHVCLGVGVRLSVYPSILSLSPTLSHCFCRLSVSLCLFSCL
jgi:hypothetical protein